MKIPKVIKKVLLGFGFYSQAHKLYTHTINRKHLARLRLEKEFYSPFIKPGDLCFDVGANIGDKTEVFLALGASVVAIEPQPYCVEILKSRFSDNEKFQCIPKGVGDKTGDLILHTSKSNVGAASFLPIKDNAEDSIRVNVSTLDSIITEVGKPKFIKIDVEGFELSVLKGLTSPIDVISFEYHMTQEGKPKAIECLRYLSGITDKKLMANVVSSVFFDNFEIGNNISFIRTEWWDIDSFIHFFEIELPEIKNYFYGDIFVRLS